MQDVSPAIQAWSVSASLAQLRAMMDRLAISSQDIQRYVVAPQQQQQTAGAAVSAPAAAPAGEPQVAPAGVEEPMEVEEAAAVAAGAASSLPELEDAVGEDEAVGAAPGEAGWLRDAKVPQEWIGVLRRDHLRQQRMHAGSSSDNDAGSENGQVTNGVNGSSGTRALSDAYLCGLPVKRRRLAQQHKPRGPVAHVLQESLSAAMRSAGVGNRCVVDSVASASAAGELAPAFAAQVRESLQKKILEDKDFVAEKFPQSDKNIRKHKP